MRTLVVAVRLLGNQEREEVTAPGLKVVLQASHKTTTCCFYTSIFAEKKQTYITCFMMSIRGVGGKSLLPLDRAKLAVFPCLKSLCKAKLTVSHLKLHI